MPARRLALVAQSDDRPDLSQGQPGGLGGTYEREPVDGVGLVLPVPVGTSARGTQKSRAFVEANGLGGHTRGAGQLTYSHVTNSSLDLVAWCKVYVRGMDVTLMYFDGCPNWREVDEHLELLASELPELRVRRQRVETVEEAERVGFHGSPTVLVDGVDAFADSKPASGLSCRRYPTPAGYRGAPTFDQVREALVESELS